MDQFLEILVHLMTKRSNTGTGGIAYQRCIDVTILGDMQFSDSLNNSYKF